MRSLFFRGKHGKGIFRSDGGSAEIGESAWLVSTWMAEMRNNTLSEPFGREFIRIDHVHPTFCGKQLGACTFFCTGAGARDEDRWRLHAQDFNASVVSRHRDDQIRCRNVAERICD